jgi:quercetin dioxygenase-like cupin family protein
VTLPTFADYERAMHAAGFPEVVVREWAASEEVPTHTHPFAVKALVVRGEMWLTEGEHTRHLKPGDGFELDHRVPHAERYGAEGATYWAARRPQPGI